MYAGKLKILIIKVGVCTYTTHLDKHTFLWCKSTQLLLLEQKKKP